jgi:hypothetical protein
MLSPRRPFQQRDLTGVIQLVLEDAVQKDLNIVILAGDGIT